MLGLFLYHAENTGGRLASLLAARHRRLQDPAFGVIDSDPLITQRNNGRDWLNRLATDARLERHRAFVPTVCGTRMIVRRDDRGQAGDGKLCRW
jgi:hypothetical protein